MLKPCEEVGKPRGRTRAALREGCSQVWDLLKLKMLTQHLNGAVNCSTGYLILELRDLYPGVQHKPATITWKYLHLVGQK